MDSYGYGSPSSSSSSEQTSYPSRYSTPHSATPRPQPYYSQYSYPSIRSVSPSYTADQYNYYSTSPSPRYATTGNGPFVSSRRSSDRDTTNKLSPRYSSSGYYSTDGELGTPQYASPPNESRTKSSYSADHPKGRNTQSDYEYREFVPERRRPANRPQRPIQTFPKPSIPKPHAATATDAKKYRVPAGYSLKNWDPTEEPILLLGSVFDANSLGKWIYDWTLYNHGPSTPMADMAGSLWMLLIQLTGKANPAEERTPRIGRDDNRGLVDDFVDSRDSWMQNPKNLLMAMAKNVAGLGSGSKHPGRHKNSILELFFLLPFLPGSLAAVIPTTTPPSLDPVELTLSPETASSISTKELAAVVFAIFAFSAKATIAYRSQTPDLVLTISLLSGLWAYSGVIATSLEDRGIVVLPLTWLYCIITSLVLALVAIYQIHSRHPLKYALLHFNSQVLLSGAIAGILVANLDSSFNDGINQFWIVIPYCFSLAIFFVGFLAKFAIWMWAKLNSETKEKISGFFSGPLN